ncbi:MAG: chemotaxis protein CheA [Syntrophorhabdales bacterium]|jgi:two-component system chemotaxis sensor kinase CheA
MESKVSEKDEMKEIIDEFIVEANELAEKAIQDIVAIENNPDEEIINSIFRAVHTIKGTSSFLGYTTLSTLAHRSEDILGMVRKGTMTPDQSVADVLLEALDLIRALLEEIKDSGAEQSDTSFTIEKLETLKKPEASAAGDMPGQALPAWADERNCAGKKGEGQENIKETGALSVEEKAEGVGQLKDPLQKQKTQAPKEASTIRIDVKKLDELMNLAGELVLGKNRLTLLNTLVKKGDARNSALDNLADITNYIELVTNELQLSVMRARLVPISKLFAKVPRLVRDLCAEFGKEIELTMEGEETELDRSLIENLHDPLIHIIRNSVDHGIGTPEERTKKGKRGKGFLSLKAYNEGNNVIIEIFDDGKGINVEAVKEKARERGLISESEIASLPAREAMNLIFAAGLSTARKVTSVSGRGVGMDVVKTNIEKMNGQVSIDSEEGGWTRLSLRLPLTLAIMRALIVRVFDDLFAIPLNTVTELVRLEEGLIKSVDKKEVLVLRDKVIPVVDLARVFGRGAAEDADRYVIICNIGERTIGLKARAVEGQEEVVIKPLGEFLGNIKGIGGATIRGDGRAILILDMSAMINHAALQNANRKIA